MLCLIGRDVRRYRMILVKLVVVELLGDHNRVSRIVNSIGDIY
jgi:hypothetical protein